MFNETHQHNFVVHTHIHKLTHTHTQINNSIINLIIKMFGFSNMWNNFKRGVGGSLVNVKQEKILFVFFLGNMFYRIRVFKVDRLYVCMHWCWSAFQKFPPFSYKIRFRQENRIVPEWLFIFRKISVNLESGIISVIRIWKKLRNFQICILNSVFLEILDFLKKDVYKQVFICMLVFPLEGA